MLLFKNTFFTEHVHWLLLEVSGFQPTTLFKKRLEQRCFSVSFAKFLRKTSDRTPPDDCFLWLSVNLRSFSDHLFYRAPLGNCLFHVQVTEFEPPDTVKKYFTIAFQAFYTSTRSCYPKAFIYLKSLKIICEQVNLQWSCEMPGCKLTKKTLSHILHDFTFIFSEHITITFSKEALNVCEDNFFQDI